MGLNSGFNGLMSNFRRVLNVVFFLLGDSPASEYYVPLQAGNCKAHKIQIPGSHSKEIIQY